MQPVDAFSEECLAILNYFLEFMPQGTQVKRAEGWENRSLFIPRCSLRRAGVPEAIYLLRGPFSKANLAAAGIEMSPAVLRDQGVLGETVPPMPPVVTT